MNEFLFDRFVLILRRDWNFDPVTERSADNRSTDLTITVTDPSLRKFLSELTITRVVDTKVINDKNSGDKRTIDITKDFTFIRNADPFDIDSNKLLISFKHEDGSSAVKMNTIEHGLRNYLRSQSHTTIAV